MLRSSFQVPHANANFAWTLKGINLENVASVTIGDQTVTAFSNQTATELTFTCPALSDGDYVVTGKTKDGQTLQFTPTGAKSQITATLSHLK